MTTRSTKRALKKANETAKVKRDALKKNGVDFRPTPKPRGTKGRFNQTYRSVRDGVKELARGNAEFIEAVTDSADGVREWMDSIDTKVGRSTSSRKLSATPAGHRILGMRSGSSQIEASLSYILGQNKSRRWDKVDWDAVQDLSNALEPYVDDRELSRLGGVKGLVWRPFAALTEEEIVARLDGHELNEYLAERSRERIMESVAELERRLKAGKKCLKPWQIKVVEGRIADWKKWAKDVSRIPEYACEPDSGTGGMSCDYPLVEGELREMAKACTGGYDAYWADKFRGQPGFKEDVSENEQPFVPIEAFSDASEQEGCCTVKEAARVLGAKAAASRKKNAAARKEAREKTKAKREAEKRELKAAREAEKAERQRVREEKAAARKAASAAKKASRSAKKTKQSHKSTLGTARWTSEPSSIDARILETVDGYKIAALSLLAGKPFATIFRPGKEPEKVDLEGVTAMREAAAKVEEAVKSAGVPWWIGLKRGHKAPKPVQSPLRDLTWHPKQTSWVLKNSKDYQVAAFSLHEGGSLFITLHYPGQKNIVLPPGDLEDDPKVPRIRRHIEAEVKKLGGGTAWWMGLEPGAKSVVEFVEKAQRSPTVTYEERLALGGDKYDRELYRKHGKGKIGKLVVEYIDGKISSAENKELEALGLAKNDMLTEDGWVLYKSVIGKGDPRRAPSHRRDGGYDFFTGWAPEVYRKNTFGLMLRGPGDPENPDRKKKMKRWGVSPHLKIKKMSSAALGKAILADLEKIEPATLHAISMETFGLASDVTSGSNISEALWDLVEAGLVEHTISSGMATKNEKHMAAFDMLVVFRTRGSNKVPSREFKREADARVKKSKDALATQGKAAKADGVSLHGLFGSKLGKGKGKVEVKHVAKTIKLIVDRAALLPVGHSLAANSRDGFIYVSVKTRRGKVDYDAVSSAMSELFPGFKIGELDTTRSVFLTKNVSAFDLEKGGITTVSDKYAESLRVLSMREAGLETDGESIFDQATPAVNDGRARTATPKKCGGEWCSEVQGTAKVGDPVRVVTRRKGSWDAVVTDVVKTVTRKGSTFTIVKAQRLPDKKLRAPEPKKPEPIPGMAEAVEKAMAGSKKPFPPGRKHEGPHYSAFEIMASDSIIIAPQQKGVTLQSFSRDFKRKMLDNGFKWSVTQGSVFWAKRSEKAWEFAKSIADGGKSKPARKAPPKPAKGGQGSLVTVEEEGFALTSPKGTAAKHGRSAGTGGTQATLTGVSRKVDANKMAEMVERDRAAKAAARLKKAKAVKLKFAKLKKATPTQSTGQDLFPDIRMEKISQLGSFEMPTSLGNTWVVLVPVADDNVPNARRGMRPSKLKDAEALAVYVGNNRVLVGLVEPAGGGLSIADASRFSAHLGRFKGEGPSRYLEEIRQSGHIYDSLEEAVLRVVEAG